MNCEFRLGLMFKEGIMKHLVVNIQSTHFRLNSFSWFTSYLFPCVTFVSHFRYPSGFNKIRQIERRFSKTSFILQKLPLLAPMLWHRNRITNCFQRK